MISLFAGAAQFIGRVARQERRGDRLVHRPIEDVHQDDATDAERSSIESVVQPEAASRRKGGRFDTRV